MKESNNTETNNITKYHRDIPDKVTGKFTSQNKIGRISYFDQSWRTRSEGHPETETVAHFCID